MSKDDKTRKAAEAPAPDSFEEPDLEALEKENQKYLQIFARDMEAAGLAESTRSRHLTNARVFLDDYLAYAEGLPMEDGPSYARFFLGYWFIRKCMWSTPASIRATSVSLKKFYQSMAERGLVPKADYEEMCRTIKAEMAEWQDLCEQYNDPDADNPFYPPEYGF